MAPDIRHSETADPQGIDREDDSTDVHDVVEGVPAEMVWRGEYGVEEAYADGLVEGGNDDDDDDDIFRILTEHDDNDDHHHERAVGVSDDAFYVDDDVGSKAADAGGEEDFVARLQDSIQRDLPKYGFFLFPKKVEIYLCL